MVEQKTPHKPTLVDLVRNAFGATESETDTKTVKIQKIGPRRVSERELQDQIRTLLADRDYARIGHLHIIGLEKVRDHFGDDWDRVAPKGMQIAEGVLRSHLVATDVVVALGNLGYLILFKSGSWKEADVKAAMIAAGIANRLMGNIQDAEDVFTVSVTESADGSVLFEEKSVLDVASGLIENKIAMADSPTANIRDDPNDPSWDKYEGSVVRPGRSTSVTDRGDSKPSTEGIRFVYKPIWDVRRKVLSTYRCVPTGTDLAGQPVSGYEVFSGYNPDDVYPELDLLTLGTVAKALEDLHSRGRRVLMVSPVHYRTLQRITDFTKLKVFCQSMDDNLRRDLIFELVGMPDVTSERSVLDLVSALKSMGRSVMVPARLNRTRFEELRISGFDTVATDIGEVDGSEAEIMQMMDTFSAGASQAKLRTVAHGLETLSLATLAVAAGFDFVEGRAVHDVVENPEHVFRFQSEDLFAKLMG